MELTSLHGADLRDADMRGTELVNIAASCADLRGAVFRGMQFVSDSGTRVFRLRGAIYNRLTRWPFPEGTRFDPQVYGARLEE